MHANLQERVVTLAALRRSQAEAEAALKAKQDAFNAEHAILIETIKIARQATSAEEIAVRAVALDVWKADEDTKPCAGVVVKLFETIAYDEKEALTWAKGAGLALIPESLDKKSFEKIAKAASLSFVTYTDEPRVTIATDLDKALASATEMV